MKVAVIGASTNPERYSHIAVLRLLEHDYDVYPVGVKKGEIQDKKIINGKPDIKDIHTVTLYINSKIQEDYKDYIINQLKPKRIIFNPGTENDDFFNYAKQKGIEVLEACTLVMLSTGQF